MRQPKVDIGKVLQDSLQQYSTTVLFDSVWSKHEKGNAGHFGLKKAMTIPIITLITIFSVFTVGFAAYGIIRTVDNIDYPFVDDQRVIGLWESVDFVHNIEQFDPSKKAYDDELYLTSLAFINGGDTLAAFEGGKLLNGTPTWTKGLILDKGSKTASKYEIKENAGETYMFCEWKSGDYTLRGMKPKYYVLKKINSERYTNIGEPRIEDKLDYPFVNDPEALGSWQSVDFVETIEGFEPGVKSWGGDLCLKEFDILENGEIDIATTSGSAPKGMVKWTKGMILDKGSKTAAKYEIKEIDGKTYMFWEWKSGDYLYGRTVPWYYVLKKVE